MGFEYRVDEDLRTIFVKASVRVTALDLCTHWIKFLEDPRTFAIRRTLVDLSQADVQIDFQELALLINSLVKPRIGNTVWITALVVGAAESSVMAQEFGLLAQSFSRDRVFTDADVALEWLQRQRIV
jgi:hypothetical protein